MDRESAAKKTITPPNTFLRASFVAFSTTTGPVAGRCKNDRSLDEETNPLRSGLPAKGLNDIENPRYLSESISVGCPTCLAKILDIYQHEGHIKAFERRKNDENGCSGDGESSIQTQYHRLYDLKGSDRARYNADSSGSNKVLLDQNLIEAMPTSPIFLGTKAKRLLERALCNDTSFLASIDVMDYSLLSWR
ncbi:1-phosphatidylinositol-3-phosphate 5-kinase fab1b [Salvia divinorum]|uniref:1-phosphatidylinositol-3-phosphate 5-kinase fab1b n=1 Tax=Salvia divinorum TaxID=28513 RepID=A0ABD1FHC0_SALDI